MSLEDMRRLLEIGLEFLVAEESEECETRIVFETTEAPTRGEILTHRDDEGEELTIMITNVEPTIVEIDDLKFAGFRVEALDVEAVGRFLKFYSTNRSRLRPRRRSRRLSYYRARVSRR